MNNVPSLARYSFLKVAETSSELGLAPSPELVRLASAADAEAIDRILTAVGRSHISPGLDKRALCADIADAYYSRSHAFDLFHGSEAQDQLKLLRRIRRTAEKLASLLKANTAVDGMIREHLEGITPPWGKIAPPMGSSAAPKPIDQLDRWLRAVARVEKGQEHVATKWRTASKSNPNWRGRRPTAAEWLAGVSLPLVYEWHFRQHAGRSRTNEGTPTGPMVAFIGATLKEFGIRYSDELIMRAFSRLAPSRQKQRNPKPGDLVLGQI